MKCIHCGSDTKYKERQANGNRCIACKHPFAFEPKNDTRPVADGLFERVIKDVSGDDTLFFTEQQLWYEFNRRLLHKQVFMSRPFGIAVLASVSGSLVIGGALGLPWLIPVGIVGAIATGIVGVQMGKKRPRIRYCIVTLSDFRRQYLQKWIGAHGPIARLLQPPKRSVRASFNYSDVPPDLTGYSFDRVLVCESAEVAAMLVANRFHFENNCAILSLDRQFPEGGRFEAILNMLRRNPRLFVFALHDATSQGITVPERLRGPNWFPDSQSAFIVDLGLRPKHLINTNVPLINSPTDVSLPPNASMLLAPDEIAWLKAGNQGQVEALRPARLMRAVYQGFNRATEVGPDGGVILVDGGTTSGVWVDSGPVGSDVYTADSFG